MVPDERFELPTFGLQNRCTTTVLIRHFNVMTFDGLSYAVFKKILQEKKSKKVIF